MNFKLWVRTGLLLLGGLLLTFCSEKKETVGFQMPFAIQSVSVPEVLNSKGLIPVLFTADVTHPDGDAGIATVKLVILDASQQVMYSYDLYDDGGVDHPGSGDVIAFDNIYSHRIIPIDENLAQGNYQARIEVTAINGDLQQSELQPVEIYPNRMPQIVSFTFPDTIRAGMQPVETSVVVSDSDGVQDVKLVILSGTKEGQSTEAFRDTLNAPGSGEDTFTLMVDSSFSARQQGNYLISTVAIDRAGVQSRQSQKTVFLENTPPVLTDIFVPEQIVLPASGSVVDTVRAAAFDRQGPRDIRSVYFISQIRKTDGSLGDPSQPIELFDNGDQQASGDLVAGDGLYSRIIQLNSTNTPGTYIFTFKVEDYLSQVSNVLIDSVVVSN